MDGQYRQITPEQRADHVDNLYLLGRLVITLPPPPRTTAMPPSSICSRTIGDMPAPVEELVLKPIPNGAFA